MALATRCPHCNTTFRVAADQLKLRGGIVRCGACKQVFDGNAMLVNQDAPAAEPAPAAAEPAPPLLSPAEAGLPVEADLPVEAEVPVAEEVAGEATEAPMQQATYVEQFYTLDFDTSIDPAFLVPQPIAEPVSEPEPEPERQAAPEAEPEPEPEPEPLPEPPPESGIRLRPTSWPESFEEHPELVPDEELVAAPVAEDGEAPDPSVLLMRESAPEEPQQVVAPPVVVRPARKAGRKTPRPAPRPMPPPEPFEPEPEEPEFVRRARLQEETGRTRSIIMGIGSVVLVLVLLIQGMTTFRNALAAQFPQLKPLLVSTCAVFGCRVELPAQIEELSIETGALEAISGGTFLLTTALHNESRLAQAWPNIELALTDADNKTVLRRVFVPAEYLPKNLAPAKGLAARSEQPVRLYFELRQIKASGYRIAVFYP